MPVRKFQAGNSSLLRGYKSANPAVSIRRLLDGPTVIALIFLTAVFLLGGNSRTDTGTLLLLRPLAIGMTAFVLLTRYQAMSDFRPLITFTCALILSVLLYLIPLPAPLISIVPGREIVDQVAKVSSVQPAWRTLSLTPSGTANAFFSLSVPIAALLVSISLGRNRRHLVWIVAIAALLAHCAAALAQAAEPGALPYLHEQDEGAWPVVGLMGNRNHFALWCACMMPLCVSMTWQYSAGRWPVGARVAASTLIFAFLMAIILVTLSRAGIFAMLLAAIATPWVVSGRVLPQIKGRSSPLVALGMLGAGTLVVAGLIYLNQRMSGVERLTLSSGHDLRWDIWPQAIRDAWSFFPIGSGWGSFVEVFQIRERATIDLSYVNHAHNDWLEVVLTGGFLGVALLAWIIALWARGGWQAIIHRSQHRSTAMTARFGVFACALLGIASLVDYPLRTPMLASMFALALVAIYDARLISRRG